MNWDYLNAAGQSDPYPENWPDGAVSNDTFVKVMHQHGITQNAIDYQPISQVPAFQLAELAIFLVLTAIAVWITFRALRRT